MTKKIIANKQLSRPAPRRTSAAVARELLLKAQEYGADPAALLKQAKLSLSAPTLLDPQWTGELSHAEFARLYAECTWTLDAYAARQEGREALTKEQCDMLCYCVITCRTLCEVIERTAIFSTMMMPRTARMTLEIEGDSAVLHMATIRKIHNACAYLSDLTGLSTLYRLFGWLIGEDIELLGVDMRYPPLWEQQTVFHLMPHPITHGAMENSLRFPAHYLDRPVIRSYPELQRLLEHFPFDLEEPQSKDAPLSERISHIIDAALANDETLPTGTQLARQFSISVATLKRILAAEDASLSQLKANARRELSQRLLADNRLAIGEVARRTHFSDTGAFSRAFRQWTGQSPVRWRKVHLSESIPA